jgi:hypothetical protein
MNAKRRKRILALRGKMHRLELKLRRMLNRSLVKKETVTPKDYQNLLTSFADLTASFGAHLEDDLL